MGSALASQCKQASKQARGPRFASSRLRTSNNEDIEHLNLGHDINKYARNAISIGVTAFRASPLVSAFVLVVQEV